VYVRTGDRRSLARCSLNFKIRRGDSVDYWNVKLERWGAQRKATVFDRDRGDVEVAALHGRGFPQAHLQLTVQKATKLEPRQSEWVRVKLEFAVRFDRPVHTVPFTSLMLDELAHISASAAVMMLGGDEVPPREPNATPALRGADIAAAKLHGTVKSLAYADHGFECRLMFNNKP
jgi:hypothetical protein